MINYIDHKISRVSNTVCETCSQLWLGCCRAYEFPHTPEERLHREKDHGIAKCLGKLLPNSTPIIPSIDDQ